MIMYSYSRPLPWFSVRCLSMYLEEAPIARDREIGNLFLIFLGPGQMILISIFIHNRSANLRILKYLLLQQQLLLKAFLHEKDF
jgi:hypothetical protein